MFSDDETAAFTRVDVERGISGVIQAPNSESEPRTKL
jgi:hypothetical protein